MTRPHYSFLALCCIALCLLPGCRLISRINGEAEQQGTTLYALQVGTQWGGVDGTGREEVYPFIYDSLYLSRDQTGVILGKVQPDGAIRYAMGDTHGNPLTGYRFDWINCLDGDYAIGYDGKAQSLLSLKTGKALIATAIEDTLCLWQKRLVIANYGTNHLTLYDLAALNEVIPLYHLDGVVYAEALEQVLLLHLTDGELALLTDELALRSLKGYNNLFVTGSGTSHYLIAEAWTGKELRTAILDMSGSELLSFKGRAIQQVLPEGVIILREGYFGETNLYLCDGEGNHLVETAFTEIYNYLPGNRYTLGLRQGSEGYTYTLLGLEGSSLPLNIDALELSPEGNYQLIMNMLPGDTLQVLAYPDITRQAQAVSGLWDVANDQWMVTPGRYTQLYCGSDWNIQPSTATDIPVQWYVGYYQPAPGVAYRQDLLDGEGNTLIAGLNQVYSFDGTLAWVTKGFTTGLMDTSGNWIYQASIFNAADGD